MHSRAITTITLFLFIVLLCEGSSELSQVSRSINTRDLSGIFSEKTKNPCFTAFIKWSANQDTKAMTSTITAEFYIEKKYFSYPDYGVSYEPYTITIDGKEKTGEASFYFPHDAAIGTKQTIGTATNIVKHNADGTKSVIISATLYSYTSLGTFTVSGTVELDPIAVVVKVTFNWNGGTPSETTKDVTYGKEYGALPEVTRTGYTFLGWFTSDGTEIKDSSIVNIAVDHILYAKYTINNYTISFDTSGGSSCSPISQDYNTTVALPNTTKAGHTFDYWCSDPALTSRYTATAMPPENITLHAKYIINNYTVTFLSDGSAVKSEQLDYQSNITHPDNLTKTGYSLAGWNSSITSVPDHNVVIGALWEANVYVVEFDPNGGDELANNTMDVTYDGVYGELPEPTREGHTFLGWFAFDGTEITSESIVNIANKHILYAHWSINSYTISFNTSGGSSCFPITQDYNTTVTLPNTAKAGHTFDCWCSDPALTSRYTATTMPPENITLHAKYTINNYTLTFDFRNGTLIHVTFEFNEEIIYPENLTREGHRFIGWEKGDLERMPAKNVTITALWEGSSKSVLLSPFGLAMVISVLVLVIIVVVVLIAVAFIRRKKLDNDANKENIELGKPLIADGDSFDSYTRIIAISNDEIEDVVSISASKSALIHIYPQGYTRPTMQEALAEVDLSKKQIELVCSACDNAVKAIVDEGKLFEGFTEKDAASIAMYTYDFGPDEFESNPFRIVNRSLAERSFANLQRASGLLYLLMTALRKLPRYTGVTLYRGVLGELNLDKDHYYVGNVITWSALSSTSPNMEETKRFLTRGPKSEKAIKTLFIIEGGWGYNIQPYSLFTDEVEILLEPERRFKVTNVVVSEITVITLQMLNTPLILPEVFGDVW